MLRTIAGLAAAGAVTFAAGLSLAAVLTVAPGQSVQAALDKARDGDTVQLGAGVHDGHVVVRQRIVLRGARGAVLDGGGSGTVVRVEAPGVVVEDLSIRGSGRDLGAHDAGVYVAKSATASVLRRLTIHALGFGVWIHENERSQLLDSHITGSLEGNRPDRGNGIQLFDGDRLLVRGNTVIGGRDGVYVDATDDSTIEHNRFEQTRYAVHTMYSHRNVLRGNHAKGNLSGIAMMFSRNTTATGNWSEDNTESGFFMRDVEDCVVKGNYSLRNGIGLFFYGATSNTLEQNVFAHNATGMKVWGGSVRNRVRGNAFVGNGIPVFFVATQDLVLSGNYWSDYFGWDQDGDGFGDRPYRVDSFTTRLVHRFPSAALLLRSPAIELLSHLEQRMPLLRVATVVDDAPLVRAEVH